MHSSKALNAPITNSFGNWAPPRTKCDVWKFFKLKPTNIWINKMQVASLTKGKLLIWFFVEPLSSYVSLKCWWSVWHSQLIMGLVRITFLSFRNSFDQPRKEESGCTLIVVDYKKVVDNFACVGRRPVRAVICYKLFVFVANYEIKL